MRPPTCFVSAAETPTGHVGVSRASRATTRNETNCGEVCLEGPRARYADCAAYDSGIGCISTDAIFTKKLAAPRTQ